MTAPDDKLLCHRHVAYVTDAVCGSQYMYLWVYNSALSVTELQILHLQCLQASDSCLLRLVLTKAEIIVLRSFNCFVSFAETEFACL